MKFAVVIFAVLAVASAQYNSFYNQGQYKPGQYDPFRQNLYPGQYDPYRRNQYNRFQYSTPAPFAYSTAAPTLAPVYPTLAPVYPSPTPTPVSLAYAKASAADARYAEIVEYSNEINPDGSYSYIYKTNNGIAAEETGVPRLIGDVAPVVKQGAFSWISPEGKTISVTYVADEFGYQPQSDAIPTPHPIPEAILRSLEYNARNAAPVAAVKK